MVPGRAFWRWLIDLTLRLKSLKIWFEFIKRSHLTFLISSNGRSFVLDETWSSSDKLNLYTDAPGTPDFGAVFGNKGCYRKWPDRWTGRNITILEFYPIVLSLYLWGSEMRNRCIRFFTDNESLVHVINRQSCKDKGLLLFVRKLVLVCSENNIL